MPIVLSVDTNYIMYHYPQPPFFVVGHVAAVI